MKHELKEFAGDVFERIQVYLKPVVQDIEKRIDSLESKELPSDLVVKSNLDEQLDLFKKEFDEKFDKIDGAYVDAYYLESVIKETTEEIVAKIPEAIHGKDGIDGKDGVDGKDGADGKDGKDGINGVDGKDGNPGMDGKPGIDGKDGRDGINGKDGKDGINGKDGEDGIRGKDGADAKVNMDSVQLLINEAVKKTMDDVQLPTPLDIDILPRIDVNKSYPRGTYASHKGGLWKSFQQTEGMDGWLCVVNGFTGELGYELVDERTTKVTLTKAFGEPETIQLKSHGLIYKGVFKNSDIETYEAGDCLSCNGSVWIAMRSVDLKSPGSGSPEETGFQLAVKRGRDGKDAK